jgi:hypothetical protein
MTTEIWMNAIVGVSSALIGGGVIALGWRVAHRQEVQRDQLAKRRELRLQFLIDACRRLEFVSNRPISPRTSGEFEKAIADIQLFGSASQVALAKQFASQFARDGTAPLDPLLSTLRQEPREELLLEKVPEHITYLRMVLGQEPRATPTVRRCRARTFQTARSSAPAAEFRSMRPVPADAAWSQKSAAGWSGANRSQADDIDSFVKSLVAFAIARDSVMFLQVAAELPGLSWLKASTLRQALSLSSLPALHEMSCRLLVNA